MTGFFYNPNIHPFTEMEKRRQAVADYAAREDLQVIFGTYEMDGFFRALGGVFDAPARCGICWRMRLAEAAGFARDNGYDAFTSTLLVSPYQDRDAIVEIGNDLARESGVKFIGDDLRDGFRRAQQFAREHGIYSQKYCGCVFSEKERFCKEKS